MQELLTYFLDPDKIEGWFEDGDAMCQTKGFHNPGIGSVGIMVLQDYYLEWYFPSPTPNEPHWPTPSEDEIDYTFYEIRLPCPGKPIVTEVRLKLVGGDGHTSLSISITGPFDAAEENEIRRGWQGVTRLIP